MQLTMLHIDLCGYGPNQGRYTGTATFKGQYGGVEIVLAPDVSEAVLKLCADSLVANARDVANNLTAQIIEQAGRKQITSQEIEA